MSENLQRRIDEAVKKLSVDAYEVALSQIRDNREAIDKIVEVLMEKETISGNDFRSMLSGERRRRGRGMCSRRCMDVWLAHAGAPAASPMPGKARRAPSRLCRARPYPRAQSTPPSRRRTFRLWLRRRPRRWPLPLMPTASRRRASPLAGQQLRQRPFDALDRVWSCPLAGLSAVEGGRGMAFACCCWWLLFQHARHPSLS